MSEGDLSPGIGALEVDLNAGLLTALLRLAAAGPLPAHSQAFGLDDLEILASALMFGAVAHAEAHPESAVDAHIRLGKASRAGVRSPPLIDAIRRGQRLEDD